MQTRKFNGIQTRKLNLANIKGKLSRAEMKNIMAGSGSPECGDGCGLDSECTGSYCNKCIANAGLGGGCGCAHVG